MVYLWTMKTTTTATATVSYSAPSPMPLVSMRVSPLLSNEDADAQLAALTDDELEKAMGEMVACADAATFVTLEHLREFDSRGCYAGEDGAVSCAQWFSWRYKKGPVTARGWVRVAKALPGLPLIRSAMREGGVLASLRLGL